MQKKGKKLTKVIGFLLILSILIPEFSLLIDFPLKKPIDRISVKPNEIIFHPSKFLFLDNVTQSIYNFSAKGDCYITIEIDNTGIASIKLDNIWYNLSYGFNYLTETFSDEWSNHSIEIKPSELQYFESLSVQPVFLAQGTVNTSLDNYTIVEFQAGGPISILTRPNFIYNWLNLELDDHTIKRFHNTSEYPVVGSTIFAYFVQGGTFVRHDFRVKPGSHTLKMRGNGSLDYIIVNNLDFDRDLLTDPEEIQKEGLTKKIKISSFNKKLSGGSRDQEI